MGTIGLTFLGILLFLTSVFMMLLILVQRGKGGGLTGALGGMGGQSAFGSKAGDVFTRITVITAIIWITLCMITIAAYNPPPRDSLNAQRNESGSFVSTDDDDETAGGMTGGDSADSDNSSDEGTSDETSADDLDKEIENLVEDDIESPADPESDGDTTETNSDEEADNSETSTDDSEDTGDEESSDDN